MPLDASGREIDLETTDTTKKPLAGRIPTVDEDPMHAPPWKVACFFGSWEVTTDRGTELIEYDVFEDPPEWAVRLAAEAPELMSICEMALSCGVLDTNAGPTTAELIRRIYEVKRRLNP